jgi:hypothetical protein
MRKLFLPMFFLGVKFISHMKGTAVIANFSGQYPRFYILVTVHLGVILINKQLDAQFLIYIYIDSLHVSSNLVLIIRRVNCIHTTSGICHIPSGMQIGKFLPGLLTGRSPTQSDIYQMLY